MGLTLCQLLISVDRKGVRCPTLAARAAQQTLHPHSCWMGWSRQQEWAGKTDVHKGWAVCSGPEPRFMLNTIPFLSQDWRFVLFTYFFFFYFFCSLVEEYRSCCTLKPVLPKTVLITSTLDFTMRKEIVFSLLTQFLFFTFCKYICLVPASVRPYEIILWK